MNDDWSILVLFSIAFWVGVGLLVWRKNRPTQRQSNYAPPQSSNKTAQHPASSYSSDDGDYDPHWKSDEEREMDRWWADQKKEDKEGKERDPYHSDPFGIEDAIDGVLGIGRWAKKDDDDDDDY